MRLTHSTIGPNAETQPRLSAFLSLRLKISASLLCKLLKYIPDDTALLNRLATIELLLGNNDEAVRLVKLSLGVDPRQPPVLLQHAVGLENLGRFKEALECYERAIALNPDFAEAHGKRSLLMQKMNKKLDRALESAERVVSLKPDDAEAHSELGLLLLNLKKFERALESFDRAIALKPDDAVARYNRGTALQEMNRLDDALLCYGQAVSLAPNFVQAHHNRGWILQELGQYDRALESYNRAINLDPKHVVSYINRAKLFQDTKRFDEAVRDIDLVLDLKRDDASFPYMPYLKFSKSCIDLLRGDFENGWQGYEWRWQDQLKQSTRKFSCPLWLGDQPIRERTILIHAEQGYGDSIMFSRYAGMLEGLGAKVVIEVPKPLVLLMSSLKGNFAVVESGKPLPLFDFHCPMGSLPLAFKTSVATIPNSVPYLFPDTAKQAAWQQKLGAKTVARVGLVWSGSKEHRSDHNRSIPLRLFERLLQPHLEFHSVQTEVRPGDLVQLEQFGQIRQHQSNLKDFSETAALISMLDLLITVDTSVAHLAGAMGKPVWILLPFVPDFRWTLDRSDSSWYPTATLFRQPAIGDWPSVILQVAERLQEMTLIS